LNPLEVEYLTGYYDFTTLKHLIFFYVKKSIEVSYLLSNWGTNMRTRIKRENKQVRVKGMAEKELKT